MDRIKDKAVLLSVNDPDKILPLDNSYKFYYIAKKSTVNVLAYKMLNESTIDKILYLLHGVVITRVRNNLVDNGVIHRKTGNVVLFIKDNKTILHKKDISLYPITKPGHKYQFRPNPYIGVIDLETNISKEDSSKVFVAGFLTNENLNKPVTYYIDSVNFKTY